MTTPTDVVLRPVAAHDLDLLWKWMHATPDPEWKLWDGPYFDRGPTPSRADFDAQQTARLDDPNRRLVELGGAGVGVVTRWEEDPAGGGWWELGIVIFDPRHWGRGLGGRALAAWTALTFAETEAHVITLTSWSGNERMLAAARRVGFSECARIPQARQWQGRRWDSVKLSLLRREWGHRSPTHACPPD